MIFQTCDELIERIKKPIRDVSKIFVININSDDNYKKIFNLFSESDTIRLSEFTDGDNYPSKAKCYEKIKETINTTLVCGYSQYLSFLPEADQRKILFEITQISVSSKKSHAVFFLFYRQDNLLREIIKSDIRLGEKIFLLNDKTNDQLALTTFVPPNLKFSSDEEILHGYKEYLFEAENNPAKPQTVSTEFAMGTFPKLPCLIVCIPSAYTYLIERKNLSPSVPEACGKPNDWNDLLVNSRNQTIPQFLSEKYTSQRLDDLFRNFGNDSNYQGRWYIWLQMKHLVSSMSSKKEQSYLSYVVSASDSVENFLNRYFSDLLSIHHNDPKYHSWYAERKIGLKNTLNNESNQFSILEERLRHFGENYVYYLTDTTENQKRLLLEWVCAKSSLDSETLTLLKTIYPDLASYLMKYTFSSIIPDAEIYSKYFQEYKTQKVTNTLHPEFCKWVDQLADVKSRPSFKLPSRAEILDKYTSDTSCVYYFIDCLGAEYLGFIQDYCTKNKLSCQINIARANVPTETEFNTEFKDELNPHGRYDIDTIKHKGIEPTLIKQNDIPYYIVSELAILGKYLKEIHNLSQHNQKVIVITDHGSSRLCVLNYRGENDATIKVKAENVKTRYCFRPQEKLSDPSLFLYNDYAAWANYNRFSVQGGPQWEIHGGASLEEIVIPIIEISQHKGKYKATCQTPIIRPKPLEKPVIQFYITPTCNGVHVEINDKVFTCESENNSDWSCTLPEDFKAGKYSAKVKNDGSEIDNFEFTIEIGMKKMSLLGGRL